MSEDPDATVLYYLREQFARVNIKLDRIGGDVTNLKVRVSSLEAEAGHVRVGLAEVNSRLDRFDARMDRIEQRLDLADATVADGDCLGHPLPRPKTALCAAALQPRRAPAI